MVTINNPNQAAVLLGAQGALGTVESWLDSPTVAFLLLAFGIGSVTVEIAHPGIVGTGVAGVAALLLGLWSLSMQPVNLVGLVLVVIAAGLFLLELATPTLGVSALLGTIALLVGGLLMIDDPVEGGVPPGVVLPTTVLVGAAVVVATRLAVQVRNRPSTLTGAERLVGRALVVDHLEPDGSAGKAFVEGSWWEVRTAGATLAPGMSAQVVAVDGLALIVVPGTAADDQPRKERP